MKSQRLDTSTKETVIRYLLQHRFGSQVSEIIRRRGEMAEELYNAAFSEKDRERMESLPSSWLPTSHEARAQIAGSIIHLSFTGAVVSSLSRASLPEDRRNSTGERKRIPYGSLHGVYVVVDAGTELSRKWEQLEADQERLKEAIDIAEHQAKRTLNSYNTTKQLVEGWPEVEPFLRKALPVRPVAKPPAVPADLLNETFELPAEETA